MRRAMNRALALTLSLSLAVSSVPLAWAEEPSGDEAIAVAEAEVPTDGAEEAVEDTVASEEAPAADDVVAAEETPADVAPSEAAAPNDAEAEEALVATAEATAEPAAEPEPDADALFAQRLEDHSSFKGLEGDSYRFQNGQPIAREIDPEALEALAYSGTWEKDADGNYHSYDGSVIVGAKSRGVDVSEWNDQPDWAKVQADDISFAILRCGGTYTVSKGLYDDSEFERNAKECERLGIPYGVYYFSAAETVAKAREEAEYTIKLIGKHKPTLPVYYDLEVEEVAASISNAQFAAISTEFCNTIAKAGFTPGIYASVSWWDNYLTDPVFETWTKWVAQYYKECEYEGTYRLWQADYEADIDGFYAGVDLNFDFENYFLEERVFPDVPNSHWAKNVIKKGVDYGLIAGYNNGTFGPEDNITRAQAATILWRMAGMPEADPQSLTFEDVDANAYYGTALAWAYGAGVVHGYGGGLRFGPDDAITREQFATMVANYARRVKGVPVTGSAEDYASMSDGDSVSEYARASLGWCFREQVLSGSQGRILPQDNATRAQATKMLVKVHEITK